MKRSGIGVGVEEAVDPSRPPIPPDLRELVISIMVAAVVKDIRAEQSATKHGVPAGTEP